ncbi:MAG: proton-conducting transporter membrane subunit [Aggregatilineales bacterium]
MPILLLVVGMPFLLGMTQHIIQRLNGRMNTGWLASGSMSVSFVLLLTIAYQPVIVGQGALTYTLEWLPDYGLNLSFYLDSLSLLFGLIITGVGTVVFLYSGYYFDETDERNRFIHLLLLFTSAMLWLIFSNNLITLFIAWELTSIISFLLIGFKGNKYASAREGATRALVVTGGGGLALLVGLLALGSAGGSYEFSDLLALDLTEHAWYIPLTLLLLLGAFTKSAQFPFHFWLPGAMDAPTPASAFLHSATMVKAGVYLLARLHPVLGDTLFWNNALMIVGLTTMLFSAVVAVRQPDLKGLLAFTTTSKLGALVALLGVPGGYGVKAALIGILAHALYKSALFLSVGNIDHATGTRLVNKLGGLWKNMPITGVVVIVSSLSMAGLPPLLGFVAKETLLEAFVYDPLLLAIVFISAALTATAGYILIWDVFFAKATEEVHFHPLHKPLEVGLLVLALATVILALFVTQLLIPLFTPLIPVEFKLVLFPGFNNVFFLSVAAITTGLALFFLRNLWRRVSEFSFNTISVYDRLIATSEWVADQVLKTQNGLLRHYLIVIISVVMAILLYGGLVQDIFSMPSVELGTFTLPDLLDVMLLVLAVGAAYASVRVRHHLNAALALAIFGYAIGGVFFVEPAPDVALVMILVETLATVVLIIMIGRISAKQRAEAMEALDRNFNNRAGAFASIRDITIAVITGVSMFAFALIALVNRDNRDSIAVWHLDNAESAVGVTDVVSAILTDFRGTDTLIEIAVFATATLGLLALLTINREAGGEPEDPIEEVTPAKISIFTPMIQVVASLVFPLTLIISAVHILYGANAPGDGFTAGIVSGLGIALYYVVFGYDYVNERFTWLRPVRFVVFGLALALINAVIPILSGGSFMGLVEYAPGLDFANLKFNTTLVFEIAIAVTVFGGVSLIMETIAHPTQVPFPTDARRTSTSEMPVIVQQPESEFEQA